MKNGGTNLHTTIQESILALISHQHFNAALPPLTDATWAAILTPSPTRDMHNERLEFLGDALMYATIGRLLLAQIPDGSPHLYTCIRGALHSNRTFSRLAEKLDILAVSDSVLKALTLRTFGEGNPARLKNKPETKATADLFETIIAAYYLDRGFEALCEWVNDIYTPLIDAANAAFCASRGYPTLPQPPKRKLSGRSQRVATYVALGTTNIYHGSLPIDHRLRAPLMSRRSDPGPGSSTQVKKRPVTPIDLCNDSPGPAEDNGPRLPLRLNGQQDVIDLTKEEDYSENESAMRSLVSRRVKRANDARNPLGHVKENRHSSVRASRGVEEHQSNDDDDSDGSDDDDDDDSLYAVGAQARLHPLRAYWERRDQENPSLEADDSGMSGEESELERMLTGGADSVSDDTLSDMDVDYSDDDADLYLPVRSTSKLGPISYRMDRRS